MGLRPEHHAIENPVNRNSVINRPHAFTMSAVYAPSYKLDNRFLKYLANGNELTLLANISSGDEESITTSTVLNGDPIGAPQRPPRHRARYGSHAQHLPDRYAPARAAYSYRERLNTKFIFEANNLFNTRNITATSTTAVTNSLGVITTPPTFAPVSSVLEGRLLQIGIRADF